MSRYDVFIVNGSVFEPDADYIELKNLSKAELAVLETLVCRQGGTLDLVIRTTT